MGAKRRLLFFLSLAGLLLIGCQEQPASKPLEINPRQAAAAVLSTPRILDVTTTPGVPPAPSQPTPIATDVPTATPIPVANLAVPLEWLEDTVRIMEQLNSQPSAWVWQMTAEDAANIRLSNDDQGMLVIREPIVIAVPLTTEWETLSLGEGERIKAQGHELAIVTPWNDMPLGYKALRIDGLFPTDTGYPFFESWSLHAQPGYEEAAAVLQAAMEQSTAEPLVHLVAVGDIMLDRSLGYAIEQGNLEYPFLAVAEQLRGADITVGNMESAMGDTGTAVYKSYPFRAPPGAAEALARAGFDIISLANNHAMDYGPDALLQAISLLETQGVSPIGAGANYLEAHTPALATINGLEIAFLAYVDVPVEARTGFDTATWTAQEGTPGLAWAHPEEINRDIAALPENIDLVVVVLHSGFEYVAAPSEPQMLAARKAIDAGADLVIGHHAHILQGIEFYGDGTIIYGTGNFAFEIDGPPETAIFHIWLDKDGVRQVEIQPAVIQFGGQPRLAEYWEAPPILSEVYYQTKLLAAR